jgi:excinuclease ABC subunit A
MQQRLAESFEAALRLAEGRALALEMDSGKEHLFNAKFACPVCHYSIAELEPRLFSFNSPVGACPSCDGLGHHGVLRPDARGGLPDAVAGQRRHQGLGPAQPYYFSHDRSLARHYKFDVDAPFEDLPAERAQALLHGSGEEEIKLLYTMESGASPAARSARSTRSKASCPNMERRYRETDSAAVREDLARYRSLQPCPTCEGTRLRARRAT